MSPMVYPCPYKFHKSVDHTSRVCDILYRVPFETKKRISLGHVRHGLVKKQGVGTLLD